MSIERADRVIGAGQEVADLSGQTFREKQHLFEWNVLSEWDQVHLVVTRDLIPFRTQ